MTLNSERLEKARCEHDWFDCSNSVVQAPARSCKKCGWTVGANESNGLYIQWPGVRSALPPVDGLEVGELIEELREQAALLSDPTNELLSDAAEALSQASSVIAGLKEANEAEEWAGRWGMETIKLEDELAETKASISSLEEENKRLREALEPFAKAADGRKSKDYAGGILFRQGALLAARKALEDHNG